MARAVAQSSSAQTGCDRPDGSRISLSQVETYIKFRALDVIGTGSYRRHVSACRERGEQWASEVHDAAAAVGRQVRSVEALVEDLREARKAGLYTLCQTVMENNTPPIEQPTVIADCSVSGKPKCHCILLRSKGRGAPSVMVQSSFGHFVLMLWTVMKMDLVIKTVTRDFLDAVDSSGASGADAPGGAEEPSMRVVSERFLQQTGKIHDLALGLQHAIEHVRLSLHAALIS